MANMRSILPSFSPVFASYSSTPNNSTDPTFFDAVSCPSKVWCTAVGNYRTNNGITDLSQPSILNVDVELNFIAVTYDAATSMNAATA